ncbi:MAG: hypothetical protein HQK56_13995, partial [Deltaproteobacteria bacterium]|nr:hypothetical protein [Deltaproteobacteria bacterium]
MIIPRSNSEHDPARLHVGRIGPGGSVVALTVFLSSSLRRFFPDYDPYQGMAVVMPSGAKVVDLCVRLGLPLNEIKLVMVDGLKQEL